MRNLSSTVLIGLLTLVSCGKETPTETTRALSQKMIEGRYRAILSPINAGKLGSPSGEAILSVEGDQLIVETSLTGLDGGSRHFQALHTASRCPGMEADANADGVVDAFEGRSIFGKVLLPFDSDLNSQVDGSEYSPLSNRAGAYFYRNTSVLERILADLKYSESDVTDATTKLLPGEGLDLSRRTVVIYGVSQGRALPPTTAKLGRISVHASVPVACGKLELADTLVPEEESEEEVSGIDAYRIKDEEDVDYGT